ncbi:hypothetical protein D5F01_LYC24649 [Larimichthys crocea]|uniref:SAP domain-containing protein n=1 Tax=Larimichthys crocea TaxID=215358 RepID=A0A6G0HEH4_LARCR|nr:hypothetical protein D5F01_LYC24649 [Larimichthys crocea]
MQSPKVANDGDDGNFNDDEKIDEERLTDELVNLKVQEVRALYKQCGLDDKGSKVDLVMRLSDKMSSRVTYNKVFEKVWGASGGWAVITCPCGVVYSLKFNLRAESPRDSLDLLLSWKHFPNISVYDYARRLALHANRRQPGLFAPFQGRLLNPTPENIKQASEGKGNSKDQTDVLRKLELVPELTSLINSQCAEQLFSGMRKNITF